MEKGHIITCASHTLGFGECAAATGLADDLVDYHRGGRGPFVAMRPYESCDLLLLLGINDRANEHLSS